jgi:hypothetical protein
MEQETAGHGPLQVSHEWLWLNSETTRSSDDEPLPAHRRRRGRPARVEHQASAVSFPRGIEPAPTIGNRTMGVI